MPIATHRPGSTSRRWRHVYDGSSGRIPEVPDRVPAGVTHNTNSAIGEGRPSRPLSGARKVLGE